MGKRRDPPPPANDDEDGSDLVYFTIPIPFDELLDALRDRGAEVQKGLITDEGDFIPQAND